MKKFINRKKMLFSALVGMSIAIWVASVLTVFRTYKLSAETGVQPARWATVIGLTIFTFLLLSLVSVLPSAIRTSTLRRQYPKAAIANCLSSLAVRSQFEKGFLSQAVSAPKKQLFYMFTMAADDRGVAFWSGVVTPRAYAVVPWNLLGKISSVDTYVMSQRITMLRLTLIDGNDLEFVVNQDRFFGLFRKSKKGLEALQIAMRQFQVGEHPGSGGMPGF